MIFLLIVVQFFVAHDGYVQRFHRVALEEQAIMGVPYSVTMAQAILETGGGTSVGVRLYNNHFGIRCQKKKHNNIECGRYIDAGEEIRLRKYPTAWWSFRDHSKYITTGKYSSMKATCGTNYRKWTSELQRRGYSQDRLYASKLNSIINRYKLDEHDSR